MFTVTAAGVGLGTVVEGRHPRSTNDYRRCRWRHDEARRLLQKEPQVERYCNMPSQTLIYYSFGVPNEVVALHRGMSTNDHFSRVSSSN